MLSRTVRLSAEKILRLPVQIDKAVLSCFKQADHRYAHPRLKIGCLCRTENGLASRAKRALFAALAAVRTLSASHLASKVAWSHFSLVGEICPQAPLNDFCKIGCAPAELSSPAARQRIAALCEYIIDIFSVSGYA